jgi:hypothetical protein
MFPQAGMLAIFNILAILAMFYVSVKQELERIGNEWRAAPALAGAAVEKPRP